MQFERYDVAKKFGYYTGFLCSYVLFTACLFVLLLLLDRRINYFQIISVTFLIVMVGLAIRRLLK